MEIDCFLLAERTHGQRSFHVLPNDAPVQFRRAGVPHSPPPLVAPSPLRPAVLAGVAVHFDPSGHHRAACAVAGVLGRRGFAVESAAARVCCEAGGRVTTNVRIQDMDIVAPNRVDERRVEVLADGLLFHGAQLGVDTTLVSVLDRNGLPRPRCAHVDGVIMEEAKRRKERRYPELSGRHGRARLVVLAAEVCGRWSPDTVHF